MTWCFWLVCGPAPAGFKTANSLMFLQLSPLVRNGEIADMPSLKQGNLAAKSLTEFSQSQVRSNTCSSG